MQGMHTHTYLSVWKNGHLSCRSLQRRGAYRKPQRCALSFGLATIHNAVESGINTASWRDAAFTISADKWLFDFVTAIKVDVSTWTNPLSCSASTPQFTALANAVDANYDWTRDHLIGMCPMPHAANRSVVRFDHYVWSANSMFEVY